MQAELLYTGSVKKVWSVPGRPDLVRFEFTDRISVFDKWIPNEVPRKGEVLCRVAAFWFRKAQAAGVRTHFVDQLGPCDMLVKRIDVEHDYARITRERRNLLVPLELIVRHYVAGSYFDRMQAGKLPGVAPGIYQYGQRLPTPFFELSTKVEPTDRLLSRDEALAISKLTPAELDGLRDVCLAVDRLIDAQVEPNGLLHADGKKEFARDADGELMLVDVFGTPDEDRWWDAPAWARGEVIQYSKEFVRQHYRGIGYKDALYGARAKGEQEPDIPAMPPELVARTTELYVTLYERITGEKFA
jgi:phosphoribosylaminoimidazole-succinocarboxamide synthase